MFGVLDATVTRLGVTNGGNVTIMDGGGRNQSSRLGFRGVEDLGGGLSAAFWLEAGINVDNGTGSNTTSNNTAAGDKLAFGASSPINGGIVNAPSNQSLTARQGLTFNRASTVSLISKDLGEVRLGRDYNPAFWNYTVFDPFGTVGAGSALNVVGGPLAPAGVQAFPPGAAYPMVRTSNSIGWLSQSMNGFRAQLQYALSESPSKCTQPETTVNGNYCWGADGDGKTIGGRLSYATGPLSAALAYSKTDYGNAKAGVGQTAVDQSMTNASAYRGNYTQMNLAGAYDMGVAKLFAQYGTQTVAATDAIAATAGYAAATSTGLAYGASSAGAEKKFSHYMLGTAVPMGALTLKATYNWGERKDGANFANASGTVNANEIGSKIAQIALGVQYDLSKRTALYSTYSSSKLTAGATTQAANAASIAAGYGIRSTLGLNGQGLLAGQSATATALDIGIRHAF